VLTNRSAPPATVAPVLFYADVRAAVARLEDPGGHRWELTQTVRDVAPEEWGGVAIGEW
jgi:hypothetical protein